MSQNLVQMPRRLLAGGLNVHPVGIGCWAIGGPDQNLGLPMGWFTASDADSAWTGDRLSAGCEPVRYG